MIANFYWSPLALGQSLRKPVIWGAKGPAEQAKHFLPSLKLSSFLGTHTEEGENRVSHVVLRPLHVCSVTYKHVQAHTQ